VTTCRTAQDREPTGTAMSKREPLWSVTGGLFAVASAILVVGAVMLLGALMPARYQFASSALDGQVVWQATPSRAA
jgi:hypothetical protein